MSPTMKTKKLYNVPVTDVIQWYSRLCNSYDPSSETGLLGIGSGLKNAELGQSNGVDFDENDDMNYSSSSLWDE